LNVRLVNELHEPTTIHWHGIRGPNAMDGVPSLTQPPVPPGGRFDYRLRPPDAGTFWYHPAGNAAGQIGRGLRGALIVDETGSAPVDRDVLAVFEDWPAPADDGSGEQRPSAVTVNGADAFDIAVRSRERIRLRLINASMTRVLMLRFDGHAPTVMAIDGQPAEPFVARGARLVLAPGNRSDLFIDMTAVPGTRAPVLMQVGRSEVPIAHLVYDPAAIRPSPLPDPTPLPAGTLPVRLDFRNAQRQTVALDMLQPAASAIHERPAAFTARRGRVVVLAFANRTPSPQTVHIHGHHVRLLDRLDDGWKPFWLDTVTVDAGKTDRVAFLADNPGRWLIDCQALAAPYPRTGAWFSVTA
jgi:FtsP/CotA-like multicopper oxidase with cupredoxin domain